MSALCNLKVLSQFCDSSLQGLHSVFISLLGLLSNLRSFFLQAVLLLLPFETNSRSLLLKIKNFLLSLLLVFFVPLSHLVEFVLLLLECILQDLRLRFHFLQLCFDFVAVNEGSSVLHLVENFHSLELSFETVDLVCLESTEFFGELVAHFLSSKDADQLLDVSFNVVGVLPGLSPRLWCKCITVKWLHFDTVDHILCREFFLTPRLIDQECTDLVAKQGLHFVFFGCISLENLLEEFARQV